MSKGQLADALASATFVPKKGLWQDPRIFGGGGWQGTEEGGQVHNSRTCNVKEEDQTCHQEDPEDDVRQDDHGRCQAGQDRRQGVSRCRNQENRLTRHLNSTWVARVGVDVEKKKCCDLHLCDLVVRAL